MIDKIFQIADIHCRNFKRHNEYRRVFKKVYDYVENNKTENSVIYLAGDIVHSKTDMSPELVDLVSDFLNKLCDICPVILITGNHDTNLNNNYRLDTLTPIVNAINNDNLHYWKDTGVYEFGGIHWSVFSVFGDPNNWVPAKDIDGDYKIALHHGAVTSAVTDMNYEIENELVTPKIFKGYDLSLLGDIHRFQYLDSDKTVCYAGSLIQQNHGEGLKHGIVEWDVANKKGTFIKIPNDIGYYTIYVDDGKIKNDKEEMKKLPPKLRLRIRHKNTTQTQLVSVIDGLKSKFRLLDHVNEKMDSSGDISGNNVVLGNVRDVEYQNRLITEFLQSQPNVDKINIDGVRHLNRNVNSKIFKDEKVVRNVIWKPITFKFSNMFSYGEDNVIDFKNKKGIQGLFAPNAHGKSTLLDALVFCMFDKCSRTWRAVEVLNNRKDEFKCEFKFEMNGEIYTIFRHGQQDKHGNVRVDVDFYKETSGGERRSLNGNDRYKTNAVIREFIGSYDDFMLTTFSSQNDNKNFIFKTQRERQELLNSFLDISIFEKLYVAVRDDLKEYKSTVKYLKKDLSNISVGKLKKSVKEKNKKLDEKLDKKNKIELKIDEKETEIDKLNEEKISVNVHRTLEEIKKSIKSTQEKIENKEAEIEEIEDDINHYIAEQISLNEMVSDFDEEIDESLENQYNDIQKKIHKLERKEYKKRTSIEHFESLSKGLENHEYDPECEYCTKNKFVIEAQQAEKRLPEEREEHDEIKDEIQSLKDSVQEMEDKIEVQERIKRCLSDIDSHQDKIDGLEKNKENLLSIIDHLKEKLDSDAQDKKKYFEVQKIIEDNKEIDEKIEKIESKIGDLSFQISPLEVVVMDLKIEITRIEDKIEEYNNLRKKLKEADEMYQLYSAYSNAVSRNGVPYRLLRRILPVIQEEVNQLLSRIVDFAVEFTTDDHKNIDCYIIYSDERKWPVELASGMERFIISIATRVSLIEITSLPRPNFIAIDEGFGVLDSDNLGSIYLLFEYLKNSFDFILCISHLEDLKDLADKLILINKTSDGFSRVEI